MIRTTFFAGVAAVLAFAAPAQAIGPAGIAAPAKSRPAGIVARAPAVPPVAFIKFCLNNRGDCVASNGPSTVDVSPKQLRQLRQVNFQINRAIKPHSDENGKDEWRVDVKAGDCEDYVLTKRRRLISLGWPANALRIAIAFTPRGEGHAVLVVSTSKGDLVLDNRNNAVLNWRDTDLRWQMIQSQQNPFFWNEV